MADDTAFDATELYRLKVMQGVNLEAVEELFPGAPVTSILLSHWHADHTEAAPALQQAAFARWGFRPPLRIAAPDRARRWAGPLPMGAEAVFYGAGFRRAEGRTYG